MTAYKLIYFDIKGRGEPIRWLFHFTGMEFVDERVQFADWPGMKDEMPMGRLPVLEMEGRQLYQSMTIGRYLGRQFGLCGGNDITEAQCDQLMDTLQELISMWAACLSEKDEVEKESKLTDLVQVQYPKYLSHFEGAIEKTEGKFLVDFAVTWADIYFTCWVEQFQQFDENMLENFPNIQTLVDEVRGMGGIKDWIESRPE